MEKNTFFLIDFSERIPPIPESTVPWQKEITDFIRIFLENDEIPVKTSGSTGESKEIMLPRTAMKMSAAMTAEFLDLKNKDTALLCLPVQYIAGKMMVVRAIHTGMKLYCMEPKVKIELPCGIDFCAMTPMQAESSFSQLRNIKKLILGGSKVSSVLEKKLKDHPGDVFETYAMTETITHIAMRKLGSQKEFHTLNKIEISTDERDCLVIGTPYFEEKVFTNDIVEITGKNTFRLKGRADFIINSGGIKINPEEMEKKLEPYIDLPFIVHFKKDEKTGQKPVLVIESDKSVEINYPEDLFPKNQSPKEIVFIKEIPRTPNGKIIRGEINPETL